MSAQGERFFDMHNQRPPTSAAVRKVTFVVVVVFYNTVQRQLTMTFIPALCL